MLQKTLYSISIVIVIGLIFYVNHESDPIMQLTSGDHRDQQSEVIKYLLADWEKPMHSTSIPLAMKNIGIAPDDDLRLKIVQIFRENNELANNIKYYGPNNYLLSNTEKLLAKYLINSYENEKRMPELEELSNALSLSKNAVESRLEFLTNAGLLDQSDDGIRLTDDYKTFGGPLRYNFHRITIDSEKSFDVWWGVDFLLLGNSEEYQEKTLIVNDSCAHCSRKIRMVIKDGKLLSQTPEKVYVQQGGGWAVDNFFWSEEHLNEWLETNPEYKDLSHKTVKEFIENSGKWIKVSENE